MKKYILAIIIITILGGFYLFGGKKAIDGYKTAEVTKGDLIERITASGTINPVSTINIGTQVSGTIKDIYVDYNSEVKEGQVLAQIDPALFDAAVSAKTAALNVAKAEVEVVLPAKGSWIRFLVILLLLAVPPWYMP